MRPRRLADSPAIRTNALQPQKVRESADIQRLAQLGPRNTRMLAAEDLLNPAALIALLRLSAEDGCQFWIITATTSLEREALLASYGAVVMPLSEKSPLGEQLFGVQPSVLLLEVLKRQPETVQALGGLSATRLPARVRRQLADAGVRTVTQSKVRQVVGHPQFLIYLTFFIYATLRAVPVSFVREFHGSLAIFWTLDVVTAIPYTWGVLTLVWSYMAAAVTRRRDHHRYFRCAIRVLLEKRGQLSVVRSGHNRSLDSCHDPHRTGEISTRTIPGKTVSTAPSSSPVIQRQAATVQRATRDLL